MQFDQLKRRDFITRRRAAWPLDQHVAENPSARN
jgi:hypothetical protein